MSLFRSIVFAATVTGLVAGLFLAVVHHFTTVPYILAAETFEVSGGEVAPAEHGQAGGHEAAPASQESWTPADGFERTFYTVVADIVTGVAFAFLLIAGYALSGRPIGWRRGLLWGLAGFASVMIAPAVGMPPGLPGIEAAPLGVRQAWWIGTALATAGGLGLLAFLRTPWSAAVAVLLIAAPHLIGAPPPPDVTTLVPASVRQGFIAAVTVSSFLFWAVLGVIGALIYDRFGIGNRLGAADPELPAPARNA